MSIKYYHSVRLIHLFSSLALLIVFSIFLNFSISEKLLLSALGIILGYSIGYYDWKLTKKRIDKRNVVNLYATNTSLYIILMVFFIIQFYPRGIFTFLTVLKDYPYIFPIFIEIVCSIIVGYNLAFWFGVKSFESEYGQLRIKHFWSKSISGKEGMISKKGVVIERCDPIGKVRIGPEVWNAESADSKTIEEGDKVIVREINGLRVLVEKI